MPPWLSLVERCIGNAEVAGSIPVGGFHFSYLPSYSKNYIYASIQLSQGDKMEKQPYKLRMSMDQYINKTHDNWSILEDFGVFF